MFLSFALLVWAILAGGLYIWEDGKASCAWPRSYYRCWIAPFGDFVRVP